jgi:hypothetical protein
VIDATTDRVQVYGGTARIGGRTVRSGYQVQCQRFVGAGAPRRFTQPRRGFWTELAGKRR